MATIKETSPGASPESHSTSLTTPDQSPGHADDIWASDSDHGEAGNTASTRHEMLSDLPSLRRQHMNDGYREGLAIGKAKVMQRGFDDGYPIGMATGTRAGTIIGILDGYLAAAKGGVENESRLSQVQKVLDLAKEELSCPSLLKGVNDEMIAGMVDVPDHIEKTLRKWELLVLGH